MYEIKLAKSFENDFKKLDHVVQKRIIEKLEYLAENPDLIKRMSYAPKDLHGLYKYRIGDWRIFLMLNHHQKVIIVYRVQHRSQSYKK